MSGTELKPCCKISGDRFVGGTVKNRKDRAPSWYSISTCPREKVKFAVSATGGATGLGTTLRVATFAAHLAE